MIAGADERVRSAFRATLRQSRGFVRVWTRRVDPADVLEVKDLAKAVGRVELELVHAQRKAKPKTRQPAKPLRRAPILILDEDAFFHPAGRIRGFSERRFGEFPEPAIMSRIQQRKRMLSWLAGFARGV